jgi:undecaprenyl phosphate-alpha-L-ara4N flippase subunit ArnE
MATCYEIADAEHVVQDAVMGYVLLLLVNLLTCAGQLCQKKAAECWRLLPHERRLAASLCWLAGAAALLGLGMLFWLGVLQRLPVGLAYPMLSLNFVLVTLAAHCVFGETVSPRHWRGVAVIMLGVILMGIG